MPSPPSTARFTAFLILSYALLGALGLKLAIPPGYASPVFPAAGLALACVIVFERRALLGVWLGSLLLNLFHTWIAGSLNPATAAIAAVIATGAAGGAWVGGWMVNRRQGAAARDLEREQDAFVFLLIGGILATVLSPSIGVTALYAAGIIESTEFLYTWWNWYVGDALGVLVFAPLVLCLLNKSSGLWGERRRRIIAPMLLTLSLVWLAFYSTAHWEKQARDNLLQSDCDIIAKRISARLITHREVLSSLCHFIEAIPDFNFRQFEQFTLITLKDNPDIFALSFNDLITEDQRPAFERIMSRLSPLGPYQITERDIGKNLVPAVARPEYVAVRYIVPLRNNQQAVGYDINSEPIRRAAIERARASNSMAVTSPIQLVQEQKERVGLLELLPVTSAITAAAAGETPARLLGFAVAVIKIDETIDIATRGHIPAGLVFQLTDPDAPEGRERLYLSDVQGADDTPPERIAHWKTGLRIGDRKWVLSVYTTAGYQQQHRPWMAWAVGVAGLMFVALLQILMLGMTGRTAVILRKNEEIRAMTRTLEEKVVARTAELRKSMESYRNQFASNSSVMLLIDPAEGAIIDANAAATRFYGYPREQLLTMRISDIATLPVSEVLKAYTLAAPAQGNAFNIQHRLADGSVRNVEVSSSRIQFGGRIVLHSIIHDVTERKQAEEALRQATDRLMLAARAGGVGIWDYDVANNTLVWDEQMFRLYGLSPNQFRGAYESWLAGLHPEDRLRCDEEIDLALQGEKDFDTGFRVVWSDGTIRNIRALALVHRDTSGRPLHMIGTNWDITAQMKAEEGLRHANETLEERVLQRSRELERIHQQMVIQEKMASVGQLAAGIAHEMNNPLNFISMNFITLSEYFEDIHDMYQAYGNLVSLMETLHPSLPEAAAVRTKESELKIDSILEDIPALFRESRRGFDRVGRIIQSMREFSHVDHTGDFTAFNINAGIENTLVIARNEYKYFADVTTVLGDLPEIRCLPEQLNQVFLNLIVNSANAIEMMNRPERGRITIRTWQDETKVYCEFSDDGPGIPADIQNRIFEPFFTTKPPGRGTGLGLSICYDIIVEKHKGTLAVHCPESGGTVFSITLPKNL